MQGCRNRGSKIKSLPVSLSLMWFVLGQTGETERGGEGDISFSLLFFLWQSAVGMYASVHGINLLTVNHTSRKCKSNTDCEISKHRWEMKTGKNCWWDSVAHR